MKASERRYRVNVSQAARERLLELAEHTGQSMKNVLDNAIVCYWCEQFFDDAGRQWAAIQTDPIARAELEAEYAVWESVTADGLDYDTW